jgi:hypothetical protein
MHEVTKTAVRPVDRIPTVEESRDTDIRKEYTTTIEVNGARIYHEMRGSGPSVLFIAGATGDAGHFQRVAEILSGEFAVVTYDRRGNSRSPRPDASGAGVTTIKPNSELPKITDTVVIDGYTQPGASPNTQAQGNDAVLLIYGLAYIA